MAAEREIIDRSTFAAQVEDTNLVLQIRNRFVIPRQGVATDLRVGDTTVVARFGVRLVLTVAVAASGTTTHLEILQSEARSASTSELPKTHPAIQSRSKPPRITEILEKLVDQIAGWTSILTDYGGPGEKL